MQDPIVLVDYQESWPHDFEHESLLLKKIFTTSEYTSINHIGSTAIPWIKAKPIIDINIGLYELKNEEEYIPRLKEAGYIHSTGSNFERWILFSKVENEKRFNLHLLEANNQRYIEQIKFKNMLMQDKDLALFYQRVKLRALYNDPLFYYMDKRCFLLKLGMFQQ